MSVTNFNEGYVLVLLVRVDVFPNVLSMLTMS